MKSKILLLFFVAAIMAAHAQTPEWIWARQSTGALNEYFYGVTADSNGNVYAIGTINAAPVTFGCTTISSSSAIDIVLVKYDVRHGDLGT